MMKKSLILSLLLAITFAANAANAEYIAKPGDLLRTADDATVVLVLDNGTRVPISADGYAVRYNNDFSLVKTVTLNERGPFSSDVVLRSTNSLVPNTVFMYETNQPGIFVVQNGMKRLFTTWTGFEAAGYDLKDVQWVGQYTWYPTGTPMP